jgi:lysozyme
MSSLQSGTPAPALQHGGTGDGQAGQSGPDPQVRPKPSSLAELLIADEGEVLHVYPDSEGLATIGVGRLVDQRRNGGITKAESRYLLANDISECEAECGNRFTSWWPQLDDVRAGVVTALCFQLGIQGLLNFVHFLAAMKAQDWVEAGRQLRASKLAKQAPDRINRYCDMLITGEWK